MACPGLNSDSELLFIPLLVDNLAPDDRHDRLDLLDLIPGDCHVIPIQHDEIGQFSLLQAAEILLLEEQVGIGAGVRD